jgi:diazepam-binding inhibitor (GABA receptor modulator, acyl-CoA-binding protein)
MASVEEFEQAVERVQSLPQRPSNDVLLQLYGLFKQATEGDVSTKRPGMLDVKGRAKWDAWSSRKGLDAEQARAQYVALVTRLERG